MIIPKPIVKRHLNNCSIDGTIIDKNSDINFRCPFCGDSRKSTHKKRGHIKFMKDGKVFFKCFNCGLTFSIFHFFKSLDMNIYNEFNRDIKEINGHNKIKSKKSKNRSKILKKIIEEDEKKANKIDRKFNKADFIRYLNERKIKKSKRCMKYIESRGIELTKYIKNNLYYIKNIKEFTDEFFKEKEMKIEGSGILIPAYNLKGEMNGFQIRIFDSDFRYFGVKLDEEEPMYFNIPNVDFNRDIFINEGFFDGCFLDNVISVAGVSNIPRLLESLKNYEHDIYVVLDNERHNKVIIKVLKEALRLGCYIYIWNKNEKETDLNDLALKLKLDDLSGIIKKNSFKGLKGKLNLVKWGKR